MSSKGKEAATKKGILDTVDTNIVRVDSGKEQSDEFGDQMKVKKGRNLEEVAAPIMEEMPKRGAKIIGKYEEVITEEEHKVQGSTAGIPEKRGIEPKSVFKKEQPITPKKDITAAKKEGMENKNDTKSGTNEDDNLEDDDEWEDLTPMDLVFKFTIELDGTSPRIWRKFKVPATYTFAELHDVIQDCMGWCDCHLHEFQIRNPKTSKMQLTGSKCNEFGFKRICGSKLKIADYFTEDNKTAKYVYDLRDYWIHTLTLDKILLKKKNALYPSITGGKMACPPENVGGIYRYYNFLKIIKNPNHPEHEEMMEWHQELFRSDYDPNYFDINTIRQIMYFR